MRVKPMSVLRNVPGKIQSKLVPAAGFGESFAAIGLLKEVQLRERQRLRMHLRAGNERKKL